MKTKLVLGALLMAVVLVGIAAAQDDIFVKTPAGGITPTFSMSVVTTDVTFPLLTVGTNLLTGNGITVLSNTGYSIAVSDPLISAKPAASQGKLCSETVGIGYASTWLAAPLNVAAGSGAYAAMGTTPATIRSSVVGESYSDNLKYSQVVAVTDPVLTSNIYAMTIRITGAATP